MAKPYRPRRWRPATPDPAACLRLSAALDISPVTAQVLYNRGLTTPEAAQAFLYAGREQILDPFLLKDMDRAVPLIRERIKSGRPIMVYGDYDVDGVTGTTILVLALRALGATVEYYIPDRFTEGYGLNAGALRQIKDRGYDFILSVDTGVSAVEEAKVAKELGMTLIVSDHHEPGHELPDVPALINPKRHDCTYPFKGLSGVGVAFKLALALESPGAWGLLDIVTLGTIADMVPLVGENRALVREGLQLLNDTQRPGLKALMDIAGVKRPVTATHIGFALGPRINALGRMGSAMQGVELLTTHDPDRGAELARHLDDENRSRQEVEAAILEEALRQAESLPPSEREHVLVLAGEGWHHGVVGICASRVLEAYHRPAILLSIEGEEARGSARSIPAFHMHRALTQVSDLFAKFGGHAAAAGMTLKRKEDIPELRRRLNEIAAQWLQPDDLIPELRIDAYVTLPQVTDELMSELADLEPHGIGNPAPIFLVRDVTVLDSKFLGRDEKHIKLTLRSHHGPLMEGVGWGLAPAKPSVSARVQVAFAPEYDTYMGRHKLRMTMRDVQVIDGPDDAGFPVNMAPLPRLTAAACQAWKPCDDVAGVQAPPRPSAWVDARGEMLAELLARFKAAMPEVAATSEVDESEHEEAEPTRLAYLEALIDAAQGPVLVRTASPWAAAGLVADLRASRPDLRKQVEVYLPGTPEPSSRVVVAPYGVVTSQSYSDTVLYHPPYHEMQALAAGAVHLLWEEADWVVAETVLGWPYPDRDALVALYKLLKAQEASPLRLAEALSEAPGPWNELRYQAGVAVFAELGLVDKQGQLQPMPPGAKLDLEASPLYRLGLQMRKRLGALRVRNWRGPVQAI